MSNTSNNPEWVRQYVSVRPRPTSQAGRTVTLSEITFGTVNSVYRFQWVPGHETGLLVSLGGTHARDSWTVRTEDIRDLAWPGQCLTAVKAFGGRFGPTTPIQWVDRS